MKPLFVMGCPRSGTTALANYLNQHESVLVCIERYKFIPQEITPSLFTFERILDYREGETNISKDRHAKLLETKDPAELKWIGDKTPGYFKHLDMLLSNNPDARFIFLYRPVEEVAESWEERSKNIHGRWSESKNFEAGVEHWNQALRYVREFIESDLDPNVLIVSYHSFFQGSEECISQLSRFLNIEFDRSIRNSWEKMSLGFEGRRRSKVLVNEEQQAFVRENKDHTAERWILNRIEKQNEVY